MKHCAQGAMPKGTRIGYKECGSSGHRRWRRGRRQCAKAQMQKHGMDDKTHGWWWVLWGQPHIIRVPQPPGHTEDPPPGGSENPRPSRPTTPPPPNSSPLGPPDDPPGPPGSLGPPGEPEGSGGEDGTGDWERILADINTIQPLFPIGGQLRTLEAQEGSIQAARCSQGGDSSREAAPEWEGSETLSVLKDQAEGSTLCLDEPRIEPPKDEIVNLIQGLWGTECETTLRLQREVDPVQSKEVLQRIRRLRPGAAPGPDGVVKKGLPPYSNAANTLAVVFNIALFRGVYPRRSHQA
ncbi:hypothetical protein J6590_036245 [Homalodisca vitripennis]|nr:hypothetical protein J6590_036245 [Homalodisca vitripennis]